MLGRSRGDGNVVIRRVLPTGKGERPSSHAPKPEDKNRGRGRSTWDSSRDGPHERGFSRPLTQAQGKGGETSLTAGLTSLSTREGERSRRTRKAFVGRQRRKREPRGGPERWLHGRRKGYRSGRTSQTIDPIVVYDVISDTEGPVVSNGDTRKNGNPYESIGPDKSVFTALPG